MSNHLEKMCLDTKFQPFRLRNDKDIHCPKNDVSVPKTMKLTVIVCVEELFNFIVIWSIKPKAWFWCVIGSLEVT